MMTSTRAPAAAPLAALALALPGALLLLVAFLGNASQVFTPERTDWMLLLGFVPAWGAGVAAYLACVVSLARGGASAAPWLAASLLFAVGAWPLMLSGIGVLAFVGALALAVGARTRPRFRDARPLALGLAALTLPALVLLLSFAAGRPSPADVLVLGALGGVALAAGWPAGRAPSPERAA